MIRIGSRQVIAGLTTHSTADCPEGSNRALMTAGRQLGRGSHVILATDADSHRTGPSRESVDALYASKGLRLNTLLSGSCPPEQNPPRGTPRGDPGLDAPPPAVPPGASPDEDKPPDLLGPENALAHVHRGDPVLRRRVRVPAGREDGSARTR